MYSAEDVDKIKEHHCRSSKFNVYRQKEKKKFSRSLKPLRWLKATEESRNKT